MSNARGSFIARGRLAFVLVLLLLVIALALGSGGANATASACHTSGPVDGSYAITVCIGDPADGATVSGEQSVTATTSVTGTSPGVKRLVFYLDGQYLLTDYQAPYAFRLPTDRFVDGSKTLAVEAVLRDSFTSERATIGLSFDNGVSTPPVNGNSFTPRTGTDPAPGQPFTVAAVGDGAGGETTETDVTNMINGWNPNLMFYLGDVYENGSPTEFYNWYGPESGTFYGRFRSITDPVVGNHEYNELRDGTAPGYFDYWDNIPHYYSLNSHGWHVIAIDSTGFFRQTSTSSPQYQWLQNDLETNTQPCTLAMWHEPLYNIGDEGPMPSMAKIWSLLASHGVDLVLNGHDHTYQRWQPLDGAGNPDPNGVTEFISGAGGHAIQEFVTEDSRVAARASQYGALKLQLNPAGAGYQFVTTGGQTLDSGSVACNPSQADTTGPAAPGNLTANASDSHEVALSWSATTDDVGVTGYDVYRDGTLLASLGPVTSYRDVTVASELTYRYQVRARDRAGNVSAASTSAAVTTPAGEAGLFSDGFESGDLSKWTSVTGLSVQQQEVFSGSWAARGTSTGAATWAYKTLTSAQTDLYYRIRFKLVSRAAAATVNLMKVRTGTGTSLLGVYVGANGKLAYRNDVAAVSTTSNTSVSTGAWHSLQLHVVINGAAGQTETWLDDVRIGALSKTESLGTTAIGRVQLGENSSGRSYDVAFDTALVDTSFILTDTSPPTTPPAVTAAPASPTAVSVSWSASTDNVAVSGYSVYRDGIFVVGLPASTRSYVDTGLEPASTHSYTVDAFDAAGNHAPASDPASATTPPDTTPPSVPSGLTVTGVSPTEVDLAWDACTDDVGVAGYTVYRDGTPLATVEAGVLAYVDTTVEPSRSYTYTVAAFDAAGNESARSDPAVANTGTAPDTEPPTAPTGLTATAFGPIRIDLSWDASTDNVGVSGYRVYRDGNPIATVDGSTLSYQDTAVAPATSYTYTVDAVDAAGNRSAESDPATTSTPADTTAPTQPTGLTATARGPNTVDLSWSASSDDVGVAGYTIYRDGSQVAAVGEATTSYSDTSALPSTTYSYTVDALDAAGNHSAQSDPASATTPGGLFSDGFETGDLSKWTSVTGLVAQQQEVFSGSWAARGTSTGAATWAYKTLSSTQTDLYYRIRFKIVSQAATVNLMKFRTSTGTSLLGAYVSSTGKLGYRNDVTAVSTTSTTTVTTGAWHSLQVHVVINGTASQTETWLDDVRIGALSKTESLGTSPVGRIQLGENSSGRTYDVAFDTVVVDTNLIS
jgi:chitodextrinase